MALLRFGLVAAIVAALAGQCLADDAVHVEASVDRRIVAVGDTFSLRLDIDWAEGVDVKPLPVVDRIGSFVVRDLRESPASRIGKDTRRQIEFLLTVFETGTQTIPSIPIVYVGSDGSTGKVETTPIAMTVESVLTQDAADIRDIKEPITVPKRWKDILLSYALLVGLAAGTAASILISVKRKQEIEATLARFWRAISGPTRRLLFRLLMLLGLIRRRTEAASYDVAVTEPDLVPEEAALKELERIVALGLAERGMIKDYYSLVSEAVRRYLERKLNVLAMESPTSLTLAALSEKGISAEAGDLIRGLLEESDLVKFAKLTPGEADIGTLIDRARRIVRHTGNAVVMTVSGEAL
jgi:hypothetical protein